MKLTDLFEEPIASKDIDLALPKIASYIAKKLGVRLIQVPGVEHYQNSNSTGFGIRYIEDGSTRCFRINWNTANSAGDAANIHSIDIFTGKSHDPAFTIHTKGISLVNALPAVVAIARAPSIGKRVMFPISPQAAISFDSDSDEVTEAVISEVHKSHLNWARNPKQPQRLPEFDKYIGIIYKAFPIGKTFTTDDAANALFKAGAVKSLSMAVNYASHTLRHLEKVSSDCPEGAQLIIRGRRYVFENPVKEELLTEAHRDDFTAEEALNDFIKQLVAGKSFTRSEFIGRYHIINAGIFDAAIKHFKDKFKVEGGKRISLLHNSKISSLKDSILAKAGIVEVSKGGSHETYLKSSQEENLEKDTQEHIPYKDTLEHLEGLVTALIKGSYNGLFVCGKSGTGKTQTVERVLHDHGMSDGHGYFKNTGSASAIGLYTLLYHHRDDIILFDDSDGVFGDRDARNLLKAATDTKKTRKLAWTKHSPHIFNAEEEDAAVYEDDLGAAPSFFNFKGRIIFISNLTVDQLDPDGALRGRAMVVNVNPTTSELFSHMDKILMDIRLEDGLQLSKEQRQHVLNILKKARGRTDVSLRTLVRALNLAASGAKNWEKLVALYS